MNFKDLDKCISGETVLVDENGVERKFVGLCNDRLVTYDTRHRVAGSWEEDDIKNWTIKKETKKLYQYAYKSNENGRWYIPDGLFSDDNEFNKIHSKHTNLFKRLDYTETEVEVL